MPFIRLKSLSDLPKEYALKEVPRCDNPKQAFKQARQIGREAFRVVYYFKRAGGFPPLLFEKMNRILEHEYEDGRCIHCGQPKPEEPTAEAKQGNTDVTLTTDKTRDLPPLPVEQLSFL